MKTSFTLTAALLDFLSVGYDVEYSQITHPDIYLASVGIELGIAISRALTVTYLAGSSNLKFTSTRFSEDKSLIVSEFKGSFKTPIHRGRSKPGVLSVISRMCKIMYFSVDLQR